jgi:hypothetical protein
MYSKFSEKQILLIKEKYPNFGADFCAEQLGLSSQKFRITNVEDIKEFGYLIYKDGCIGFERKFKLFNRICGLNGFKIISPAGQITKVFNLRKWANDNGENIQQLYNGLRFGKTINGWQISRI